MERKDATILFGPIRVIVDAADKGGDAYRDRGWHEEYVSALYEDIERVLRPEWAIDIGANYGVTSLFAHMRFPAARIIAVEPHPRLAPYIRRNFDANGLADYRLYEAFAGDRARTEAHQDRHPGL